mmetsp:Transcript_5000/g.14494  ORF Transcript_5000/g.14494 Transcript_5000/m.14494 type:complete len:225 (-) Transcript_5000:232-906(-)
MLATVCGRTTRSGNGARPKSLEKSSHEPAAGFSFVLVLNDFCLLGCLLCRRQNLVRACRGFQFQVFSPFGSRFCCRFGYPCLLHCLGLHECFGLFGRFQSGIPGRLGFVFDRRGSRCRNRRSWRRSRSSSDRSDSSDRSCCVGVTRADSDFRGTDFLLFDSGFCAAGSKRNTGSDNSATCSHCWYNRRLRRSGWQRGSAEGRRDRPVAIGTGVNRCWKFWLLVR